MSKTVQSDAPQKSSGSGQRKKAKGLPRRTGNSTRKAKYARSVAKQVPRKIAHVAKRNGRKAVEAINEFYLRRKAGMDDHTRLEFPRETGSVRDMKRKARIGREG